ncbi:hypothetical protein ACIHCQ_33265 [Streptomyces sp. NPDC052236]|uniref:hypothetical protein n=1 Tax=Streptomyces sp. NPDC052236 TaxID=3365686 RepID=UPI0037D1EC75
MPDDLRSLVQDVPLVTDRVLLELANSMVVAEDLTKFRREQTISRTLLARIIGRERQRELLTTQALIDGQHSLVTWATELSGHVQISDLALSRVADCVGETRRQLELVSGRASAQLTALADVVAQVAEACEERFVCVEDRLSALERQQTTTALRLEAEEGFELSVGRWSAGQSYARLPWPLQVILLAMEVAAGPAGTYSFLAGRDKVSERLVNTILTTPRPGAPQGRFTIAELIDEACNTTPPDQLQLVAEILGSGLEPSLTQPASPLIAVAATAVELWTLPGAARPPHPAETAHALVHRRHGQWTSRTSNPRHFVERVVAEQAAAARTLRERLDTGVMMRQRRQGDPNPAGAQQAPTTPLLP